MHVVMDERDVVVSKGAINPKAFDTWDEFGEAVVSGPSLAKVVKHLITTSFAVKETDNMLHEAALSSELASAFPHIPARCTSSKMVKLAILAFVVAQLCILQAQASHYIQWRLVRAHPFVHTAGICIRDGDRVHMTDHDQFASSVQNYGYHKNGWSANVSWKNEDVHLYGHGTYQFDQKSKGKVEVVWEGCWDTDSDPNRCANFRAQAKKECDAYLKNMRS
ncbi:hypothetical protein BGX33_011938 [Mortierella sp. NVP41]|nr:hypothetical protein BGX33_011938 [Mortierella sp. NVP41]